MNHNKLKNFTNEELRNYFTKISKLNDFEVISVFIEDFNKSFSLVELSKRSTRLISSHLSCFDFDLAFIKKLILNSNMSNPNSNFVNRLFDIIFGLNFLCPRVHQFLKSKKSSLYFEQASSYYHFCLSYDRLVSIFSYLDPKESELIIDLGSGYGRVGQFLGHFYPLVKMIGLEIQKDLVGVSRKLAKIYKFDRVDYRQFDLLENPLIANYPRGKYYFFYDAFYGSQADIFYNKMEKIFKSSDEEVFLIMISGWSDNSIQMMNQKKWATCIHTFKEYEEDSPVAIYSNI